MIPLPERNHIPTGQGRGTYKIQLQIRKVDNAHINTQRVINQEDDLQRLYTLKNYKNRTLPPHLSSRKEKGNRALSRTLTVL